MSLKRWKLLYLLPGVEDHDVIGGEVVLGHLPWHLLDLTAGEGFSGLMYQKPAQFVSLKPRPSIFPVECFWWFDTWTVNSVDYPQGDCFPEKASFVNAGQVPEGLCRGFSETDLRWSSRSYWSRRRAWVDERPSCPWAWWTCGILFCHPESPRTHLSRSQTHLYHYIYLYYYDFLANISQKTQTSFKDAAKLHRLCALPFILRNYLIHCWYQSMEHRSCKDTHLLLKHHLPCDTSNMLYQRAVWILDIALMFCCLQLPATEARPMKK